MKKLRIRVALRPETAWCYEEDRASLVTPNIYDKNPRGMKFLV